MKKKIILFIFFLNTLNVLLAASPDKRWVSVEKTKVKENTGWFSKVTDTLFYGDEVLVLSEKGKWNKVSLVVDDSVSGWIPSASLTTKKITTTNSTRVSADAQELSLAGKGFTEEIENAYGEQNSVDYNKVDEIEQISVDDTDLYTFLINGNLKGIDE
ncbi:MAG: hypothetical protein BKP49_02075 [Treponema sp. CETP13]|nr:MAG: hypothetical protein BKP49_02075 [Treponema sp. CETP13]